MLARRALTLEEEIAELDAILKPLVNETAPELISTLGIGTDAASALLVAAGDNPGRLRNEAAFAPLRSLAARRQQWQDQRHRLNRSGDRQANSALWHIVLTRMVYDPRTTEYIDRRRNEGKTKKEAVRCLKRYVAREAFSLLPHDKLGLTAHRSIERAPPTPPDITAVVVSHLHFDHCGQLGALTGLVYVQAAEFEVCRDTGLHGVGLGGDPRRSTAAGLRGPGARGRDLARRHTGA